MWLPAPYNCMVLSEPGSVRPWLGGGERERSSSGGGPTGWRAGQLRRPEAERPEAPAAEAEPEELAAIANVAERPEAPAAS